MAFFNTAGVQVTPTAAFGLSLGQSAPPLTYFSNSPVASRRGSAWKFARW